VSVRFSCSVEDPTVSKGAVLAASVE
jgi:hypothetical protein